MSSDGKLSGAVNSVATSGVAMNWKEWQRSLQDLLLLDGKELFWVGFGMNPPTHEINRKRCNLEKNLLDNCKRLTKVVSSYNLQFVIK